MHDWAVAPGARDVSVGVRGLASTKRQMERLEIYGLGYEEAGEVNALTSSPSHGNFFAYRAGDKSRPVRLKLPDLR